MLQGGRKESEERIHNTIMGGTSQNIPATKPKNLTEKETKKIKYVLLGIMLVVILVFFAAFVIYGVSIS